MKHKKIFKFIVFISMLLFPCLVFASSGETDISFDICLWVEAFVSIPMSVFVLKPLSDMIFEDNSKKTFWILFIIRIVFLLACDFLITPLIFVVDFIVAFLGPLLVNLIAFLVAKIKSVPAIISSFTQRRLEKANTLEEKPKKIALSLSDFDHIYKIKGDGTLKKIIINELDKAGVSKTLKLIPDDLLKRKIVLSIIFLILLFSYITLIFFHLPVYTYIIGFIILLVFFKNLNRFNFIKYLMQQAKERPSDKISTIIMYEKNNLKKDNTRGLFLAGLFIAVIVPLIIFSTPKIFYVKTSGGYAVRYYAFGLTNYKTATIPEYYKNKKVISLSGNLFSNMRFLESVKLPNSIVEIRGQAFKNCSRLNDINIPNNLEYLGGKAFYNARSIKKIELPDTLTYLGGESFYLASSLEYIKLSNNITEIRGDSFKYCSSLKSITIPDNVVRIGGHAFYGDNSLSEVTLTKNSKLTKIGSSAFRNCSSLYYITIPKDAYVNERAFKLSPTVIRYFN